MSTDIQFSALLNEAITQTGVLSKAYQAFHSYSLGNQMAALAQLTARGLDLGPIASFNSWKEKGRSVKKGAKAIALCMPITCKGEKINSEGNAESFTFGRFMWRNNWFVVTETQPVEGFTGVVAVDAVSPAWDAALALSTLSITETPFAMLNGNCQGYATAQSIAINPVAALPHKTRFHEMAHVVLGHTKESTLTDSDKTPKDIKEVEAESVAYILCSVLGLAGLEESRGYIQHWLRTENIAEKSAQRIFSTANKILKAGQPV
jgi:hypothetical protein